MQNGGPDSRNKLRTAPLWGLRTRARLLHDGSASNLVTAIQRHESEARRATFRPIQPISLASHPNFGFAAGIRWG